MPDLRRDCRFHLHRLPECLCATDAVWGEYTACDQLDCGGEVIHPETAFPPEPAHYHALSAEWAAELHKADLSYQPPKGMQCGDRGCTLPRIPWPPPLRPWGQNEQDHAVEMIRDSLKDHRWKRLPLEQIESAVRQVFDRRDCFDPLARALGVAPPTDAQIEAAILTALLS